jgi:hypothetical protein
MEHLYLILPPPKSKNRTIQTSNPQSKPKKCTPFKPCANKRAKYIRYRLYAIAAKVIKTGRKVIIKCQAQYYQLLTKVLNDIKAFKA